MTIAEMALKRWSFIRRTIPALEAHLALVANASGTTACLTANKLLDDVKNLELDLRRQLFSHPCTNFEPDSALLIDRFTNASRALPNDDCEKLAQPSRALVSYNIALEALYQATLTKWPTTRS